MTSPLDPQPLQEMQGLDHQAPRATEELLREPSGWQPIETAPKSRADANGRIEAVYLLGFVPDATALEMESCIGVIWWEPLLNGGKGQWYGEGSYALKPTLWMHLPPAPTLPGDPA